MRYLASFLQRSPDPATAENLRRFQLHLVDRGVSPITLNATITGLKFFFDVTLNRGELVERMSSTTAERLRALLVEHGKRMAVHSDESGIFLIMAGIYNGGTANIDVFLQGHAGTPMRVDRAGRAAHVDKPALPFGLLLQPDVLADVASSRHFRAPGLLARFLYAMPASNVGRRDVRKHTPIPADVRDDYKRHLFGLLEGVPGPLAAPKVLPLSDAARGVWLDLAEEIERQQEDGGRYESISDWTGKLPGAVARIAALLELAEMGLASQEVSQVAMERALRLGRLLIPHAQAAFGLLGTDAIDGDAAAILNGRARAGWPNSPGASARRRRRGASGAWSACRRRWTSWSIRT